MSKINELSFLEKIEMLDEFKKRPHSNQESLLNSSKSQEALLLDGLTRKNNSGQSEVRSLVVVKSQQRS